MHYKTFTQFLSLSLLVSALVLSFDLSSQRTCGTTELHQHKMETDSDYAERYRAKMQRIDDLRATGFRRPPGDIVTIPVAVHYEGIGISMDCAIQKAESQIQVLNEDFGATNADLADYPAIRDAFFPGILSGSTCFNFALATQNHPAASGIPDGQYAITIDAGFAGAGGNIAPGWEGYLNFFVYDLGGGLLGFSPLAGVADNDGPAITISAFGTVDCDGLTVDAPYDLGRTATHEAGHYLNLNHPFESPDCVVDSDNVPDTPISNTQYTGCPNMPTTTCTDPALWTTYMEYCEDACLIMFTAGQTDMMDDHFTANVEPNLVDPEEVGAVVVNCLAFSGSRTVTNETCDGNDGQISMSTFNGNPPFEYSINGGLNFFPTSVFQNMTQGTYELVIRDAFGCEWVGGATINRSPAQVNIVSLTPSFCGNPDGEIVVNVPGNTNFNYFINGVQSTDGGTFSDIAGGQTYNITVAGNNGCLGGIDVALPNEDDLEISVDDINPVSCFLFDNGSITFSLGGGEAPFRYILDGLSDSTSVPQFDGLAVGEYNISVIDGRGCESDIPFQIFQGSGISEDCPCEVFAPTAMTVDQDDLNEYFEFYSSCPIKKFDLQIFGRNGQLVFETQDINDKWNGGASAEYYVAPEVFFYRLRFSWGGDEDIENIKEKTGFITVLR